MLHTGRMEEAASPGESAARLLEAVRAGDEGVVERLLEEEPALARTRGPDGVSALMQARYRRSDRLVELLAARAGDLDLFESAALGRSQEVAAWLQRQPELARAYSPDGFTALHLAAFFGWAPTAAALLSAGADPNAEARNESRVRPLHSAVAARAVDVARLLLEHGAEPNVRQAGGWTPLQGAALHGQLELASLLVEHGADPRQAADDGRDAVSMAREGGHQSIVKLLQSPGR